MAFYGGLGSYSGAPIFPGSNPFHGRGRSEWGVFASFPRRHMIT